MRAERKSIVHHSKGNDELAIERTREALRALDELKFILQHALDVDATIDWDNLKSQSPFRKLKHSKKPTHTRPPMLEVPREPSREMPTEPKETDLKYMPSITLFDRLFATIMRRKRETAARLFEKDHLEWEKQRVRITRKWERWEKERVRITRKNLENEKKYETQILEHRKRYDNELKRWKREKEKFLERRESQHKSVDMNKQAYFEKNPRAIVRYCKKVLRNSSYPKIFPGDFRLEYSSETKILVVDFRLPAPDDLPILKEVKYNHRLDEFKEIYLSEREQNKLYDSVVYQVALRSVHELFHSDVIQTLDSIVLNGWVKFIDEATGKEANACILSLQANLEEFSAINLHNVDPKACFTGLKGVGSARLHGLTPVAPLLRISREDERFVSSYDVADMLDHTYNLAAMEWEDFEHLVREVFEKEFREGGGEVKITRASRDRGVDAIAFDPDPIRGGKIIIQAKRYTNVVGVEAVRDLYGTVMNEGATKGILVTTSNYGPDAYKFARGKPLTLLNGSNLLHLLGKHGHKAKIDLKEAKRILAEREREK